MCEKQSMEFNPIISRPESTHEGVFTVCHSRNRHKEGIKE